MHIPRHSNKSETQHSLEKLIPGVHRADGDIELIHAFMLKLQTVLSKDLVSRDSTFPSLTAVIEAAKRLESVKPVPSHEHEKPWKPQASFAAQATQGSMSNVFTQRDKNRKSRQIFLPLRTIFQVPVFVAFIINLR